MGLVSLDDQNKNCMVSLLLQENEKQQNLINYTVTFDVHGVGHVCSQIALDSLPRMKKSKLKQKNERFLPICTTLNVLEKI